MSEGFKNNLKVLYEKEKLSDFEYNQLVCLNSIMGSLVGIDTEIVNISKSLKEIKYGLDVIAAK
jgi:hypothetical protein